MMRMMRMSLVVPWLAFAAAVEAQTADVRSYWDARQHEIRSSVNHLDYRLFVSLPPGYSATDTTTYPVLYTLDGNDTFPLVQSVRRYLGEGGAMPRVIIVGVGYPDSADATVRRTMDLTPSPAGNGASRLPSGGAPAFLETLRRDVIPLIEKTYRARGERALLGHSYGGLFALYVLHAAPELFERYGIFGPATWWDGHRLRDEVAKIGQRRAASAARVFVAVGADENEGMRDEADSVAAILARVHGTRLTLASRRFPGNHASYFPEAVAQGLVFLYPAPGCLEGLSPAAGRLHVVLEGPDRVEVERFVRDGSDVTGRAFRTGGACFRYRLTAEASGRVTTASLEQNLGVPRTAHASISASRVRMRTTEPARERSFEVAGPTALHVPLFVASLDQLVRLAPSRVGDSTRVLVANFRHADTATFVVTRVSPDSVGVRHPNVETRVHVSDRLEILGGTTAPAGSRSAPTRWVVVRQR